MRPPASTPSNFAAVATTSWLEILDSVTLPAPLCLMNSTLPSVRMPAVNSNIQLFSSLSK